MAVTGPSDEQLPVMDFDWTRAWDREFWVSFLDFHAAVQSHRLEVNV